MEKIKSIVFARDVRWNLVLLGVLLYVLTGQIVQYLPNPMVPSAILALNMVVPVVTGCLGGVATGALTGLLGTALNSVVKIPIMGVDWYEVAAIVPHTLMGATAGWVWRHGSRFFAAMTVLVGHGLNLVVFLLTGLLAWKQVLTTAFWNGLLAETSVDAILIMLVLGAIEKFGAHHLSITVQHGRLRQFLLATEGLATLILLLLLNYVIGATFAGYLFVIPVALTAVALGSLEAWLTALLLSVPLGITILQRTPLQAQQEMSLIFALNLVALVVGELARDVRHQRKLAQERLEALEQAHERVIEADRLKAEMIQNISHELRTPLSIILGYTRALSQNWLGELSPEQQHAAESAHENAYKLVHLVDQVTVLHQVDQGNLTWQSFSLGTLVLDKIEGYHQVASRQGCPIKVSVPKDVPLTEGDADYLGRAFSALLDNAIKFSPDGGEIAVNVWAEADRVCLSVQDHGLGILSSKQDRLFKRFSQLDGSTKRHFGGTGIGLALVDEVVRAHGGQAWVKSRLGDGSTFGFWIPLQSERSGSRTRADLPAWPDARSGVTSAT